MEKAELVALLQESSQQWKALLDQIGTARMDEPGVSGSWSMKDIVGHLAGWQERLTDKIEAAERREPEPPTRWPEHLQSDDEINAWFYEANRGRAAGDVAEDSYQALQRLITVIESLPANSMIETVEPAYHLIWVDDKRFLAGEFFDHFRDDHEPDVRAWLARAETQQDAAA